MTGTAKASRRGKRRATRRADGNVDALIGEIFGEMLRDGLANRRGFPAAAGNRRRSRPAPPPGKGTPGQSYRACPTRRTKANITAIRDTIVDVIGGDPPMTVRQVFYQLVTRDVIEKTEAQYQGTVIRLMTEMRLSGDLRFDWVVDESRRVRITQTYDSVADAIDHTARFYRRSALAQSSDCLEIWCEKDALAGVLWDVTSDYDVPLMISRGMPSLTFLHGSAQAILRAAKHNKQSFIYQFGDHDPSGVLIPQTIERRLTEMCERLDCPAPSVERVALTKAHIRRYRLPTRPTKREGNRHAEGFAGDSVELDALQPRVLRDMVRDVIERHISPAETMMLRQAEDSERELLRALRPDDAS
jgi:hypothetical protein